MLMGLRNLLVPAIRFSPQLAYICIFIGLIFNFTQLYWLGILFYAAMVGFIVLDLPIEIDASRRATRLLTEAGLLRTRTTRRAPAHADCGCVHLRRRRRHRHPQRCTTSALGVAEPSSTRHRRPSHSPVTGWGTIRTCGPAPIERFRGRWALPGQECRLCAGGLGAFCEKTTHPRSRRRRAAHRVAFWQRPWSDPNEGPTVHPANSSRDLWALLRQAQQIPPLMRGRSLAPAFRERLMLTVTQVNGCRYCAYAHARMALAEGLSHEEIEISRPRSFEEAPPAERAAIRYAQHWAAADGLPDPQAVQELHDLYGEEQAAAIDLSLRLIRVGNLVGNTWDKLARRLGLARNAPAP